MPELCFSESEIEDNITSSVNLSGLAYVGRKYKGRKVRILVIKDNFLLEKPK